MVWFLITFSVNNNPIDAGGSSSPGPLTSPITVVTSLAQTHLLYCDSSLSWADLWLSSKANFCHTVEWKQPEPWFYCYVLLSWVIQNCLSSGRSVCVNGALLSCLNGTVTVVDSCVNSLLVINPFLRTVSIHFFYYSQDCGEQTVITSSHWASCKSHPYKQNYLQVACVSDLREFVILINFNMYLEFSLYVGMKFTSCSDIS